MSWYISRAEQKTLSLIQDAAALSARAKNKEERLIALDAWKKALSRPRYEK